MPGQLTFGVEFEFSLACSELTHIDDGKPPPLSIPSKNKRDPGTNALFHYVASAIEIIFQDAGLRTLLTPITDDAEQGYPIDELGVLSRWIVVQDISIVHPNELYEWVDIEINSPVMYFCPASLQAVQLVCHLLTSNFRINVNSTCGLHVHVGNGVKGFDFGTIQNLMGFMYAFDPVLLAIHPPHRADTGYAQNTRLSSDLTTELIDVEKKRLGLDDWYEGSADRPAPEIRLSDGLSRIFEMRDINGLRDLIGHGWGGMAVNLSNLTTPFSDPYKRTVEFRQHASTLNGDRVVAWVQLVAGLIEWCRDIEPVEYTLLMHSSIEAQDRKESESPAVWELLRTVGLHEPAHFYESRLGATGQETEENVLPQPGSQESPTTGMYAHPGASLEDGLNSSDSNPFETEQPWGAIEPVYIPASGPIPTKAAGAPGGPPTVLSGDDLAT